MAWGWVSAPALGALALALAVTWFVTRRLTTPVVRVAATARALATGDRRAALHDQTLRRGRVVGDLGELAEAESARLSLHLTEVDLSTLVRAAVADREAEPRTAGLTVHTRTGAAPLPVHADADRLHQALGNLPSNAARHCRPGDTVTVTTSTTAAEAFVEVADTGPGIPADELPHVFDRLWRGSPWPRDRRQRHRPSSKSWSPPTAARSPRTPHQAAGPG